MASDEKNPTKLSKTRKPYKSGASRIFRFVLSMNTGWGIYTDVIKLTFTSDPTRFRLVYT